MKPITRCFTGHRRLPADKTESIIKRLSDEIDNLYRQGVMQKYLAALPRPAA